MKFNLFKSPKKEIHREIPRRDANTMSINEAENIIDIVADLLEGNKYHYFFPVSSLKGHSIYDIDTALKLAVAKDFIRVCHGLINIEEFEKNVKYLFGPATINVYSRLVSDDKFDELSKLKIGTEEYRNKQHEIDPVRDIYNENGFKDLKYNSLETIKSFSDFCKDIGGDDPLYWQKVYTRIGLEYTKDSPRENNCV